MIRSHFAGFAPWPGTSDGQIVRGRATGIWVGGVMRGGLYVASVYMFVNRGLRYGTSPCENPNWTLLLELLVALRRTRGPWIIGGDWNMSPEELMASGWLEKAGGAVVASQEATCDAADEGTRIDFFVVAKELLPYVEAVSVVYGAPIKTHRPVQLRLRTKTRRQLVRT